MVKKYQTLGNLLKSKRWKKATFVDEHRKKVRQKKAEKRAIRKYQSKHNGRLPDITNIPYGYYCTNYKLPEHPYCPHYSTISFKEAEVLYGLERIKWAEDDGYIGRGLEAGACNLLMSNDYLRGPWSLLWDGCKECPFHPERHAITPEE